MGTGIMREFFMVFPRLRAGTFIEACSVTVWRTSSRDFSAFGRGLSLRRGLALFLVW